MDAHALRTLEFDKIRDRLARHTSFSAGRERMLDLKRRAVQAPHPRYAAMRELFLPARFTS